LRQQDLNRIFTITDLEQFSFLPNQAEILARAISLNQDRYNPSEFDNEPLVVNLSTDESAQLTCSNADL
jgi:hypothetical protein